MRLTSTAGESDLVIIGVPKESYPGERRVALVPAVIPNLAKAGFQVVIQAGAGEPGGYPDAFYLDKGAKILPDRASRLTSTGRISLPLT